MTPQPPPRRRRVGVLSQGVVRGRVTFCTRLKYIRMTASSNFGHLLSVPVASAFLPLLPMLPLQRRPADIGRFRLFFGPISSLFDIVTFAVTGWVFQASSVSGQGLFQSAWFVVGLPTQTPVVHLLRTPRLPFVHSCAAAAVTAMTLAIRAVGLRLPQGPLDRCFRLQALPAACCRWLVAVLAGYCALTSGMKRLYIRLYIRRYGWQ